MLEEGGSRLLTVENNITQLSADIVSTCLATLRNRDAWDTSQQPLRFAHLPEMREQGGRATSTRCYRAQRLRAVFQSVGRPREVLSDRPPEWCIEESVLQSTLHSNCQSPKQKNAVVVVINLHQSLLSLPTTIITITIITITREKFDGMAPRV